jgi:putative CocE/NonD family hydrolase
MKFFIIIFSFISVNISIIAAINPDSVYLVENYSKAEYQMPMRDGAKLYTIVYSPKDISKKYPILFNRTPYNIEPYDTDMGFSFRRGLCPAFLREGYIFVFQDLRGRFMSEGVFHHMTPFIDHKTSNNDVDESSDAYDTMDWLIKNLTNHNGRIGMWGISYPGFYTSCAAVNAHPALKCVSPQAPIADWFFDDVHHCGAFFLIPNLDFFGAMDIPRHGRYKDWLLAYHWGTPDAYNFCLNLGPLQNVKTRYYGDSIGFWNDIVAHPDYDEFWQKRNILPHLKNIKPAVLVVGGWYDAEDLYGTFHTYQSIEKRNPGIKNTLVIGPWIHGGWARTDGSYLGNVSFGSRTSYFYRDSIELPFFNYYLKDKGLLNLPEAWMFMTGENKWVKYDTWPPKNIEDKNLFLKANGELGFTPENQTKTSFDEFVSDPQKPVPYTEDVFFGMTKEYMTDDQRFAARRPDVLVYQTPALSDDIILAGPLMARLEVSTTGSDADWVVKLIDVYPGDALDNTTTRRGIKMGEYQQMVRSEVIRGRYRKSYEKPVPFEPGKIEEINLELQDVLHCFKKGHRIMVQVQSTWFPLVDLNPQKFVPNIYEAKSTDFIKTTHRVYHQKGNESFLKVGILR